MQMEPVFNSISEMVSIIGDNAFSDRFFGIMQRMVGADHCTVFVSNDDGVRTLVAEAKNHAAAEHVRHLAGLYRDGGYLADPVWNRPANPQDSSEIRPQVIAPAYFEDPAYRREYYEKPNILEELAVSAEVCGGRRVYASFYRERGHPRFSQQDMARLQATAPVAIQVLGKHAEVTQSRQPVASPAPVGRISREELFARVSDAMMNDNRLLTRREAEICTGIVLGYTILGLSMNLGISVNTVATHRKRAYAKLRISSQNELFAHYFALVESLG